VGLIKWLKKSTPKTIFCHSFVTSFFYSSLVAHINIKSPHPTQNQITYVTNYNIQKMAFSRNTALVGALALTALFISTAVAADSVSIQLQFDNRARQASGKAPKVCVFW
jgi:hypothetical protein